MLTDSQLVTLRTVLLNTQDSALQSTVSSRNDTQTANILNSPSTFIVWKSFLSPEKYKEAIVWTEVDALAAGKARIWEWLTANMSAPIQVSSLAVRQGLADCWASNTTTRTNLLNISKRAATKGEQIFATGTGTEGSPGTLVWEGYIDVFDIGRALNG